MALVRRTDKDIKKYKLDVRMTDQQWQMVNVLAEHLGLNKTKTTILALELLKKHLEENK